MTVIEQHFSQLTNLNKKLLLQLEVSFFWIEKNEGKEF